ncbi:PGF-pre-PGF domain-containing protein [Halomicrococcus gelatinilyticus]|uniref:PGF-pre-PGF domain-containing protein n=1 Tax=Halomicrococcus gelatinilyticus TaxID=1702103 RepID=UPI002E0D2A57
MVLSIVVALVAPVAAVPLGAGGEDAAAGQRSERVVQRPGAGEVDAVERTRLLNPAPMASGEPDISNFTVTNPSGRNVSVIFDSHETLSSISVTIERNGDPEYVLDEDDFSKSGTGPYTYSATYKAGEDAEFNATLITAEDSDGNDGADSESGSTIVDTTPPTISGISVSDETDTDGTVANGDDVRVSATVNDTTSDVASVTANLSAFGAGSAVSLHYDSGNTYVETVPVGNLSAPTDGNHTVTVEATDTDVHTNTANATSTDALTVDTTAPNVTDVGFNGSATQDGEVHEDDDVTVEANVSDDPAGPTLATSAPVTADLSAFGAGASVELTDGDGDGVYDATVSVDEGSAARDGNYTVNVTAEDEVGHSTTAEVGELELDTPPDLSNYTVTNPSGQELAISFDSSEALSTIAVDVSGATTATLDETDFTESGGPPYAYDATWNASTDGNVTVTLSNASDADGTNGSSGQAVDVTLDTTPPSVSNLTLADDDDGDGNVTHGDTIRIDANVTDNIDATPTVEADAGAFGNGTVTLTDADGDGVYNATATVDGSASTDGERAVTVDATDDQGNRRSTTSDTLTLDTAVPTVTNGTLTDATDGNGIVGDDDNLTVSVDVDGTGSNVVNVTANLSAFGGGSAVELTHNASSGAYDRTVSVDDANASADGQYSVDVTAKDDADNVETNATDALKLDTRAPVIKNPTLTDATDGNGTVGDGHEVRITANVTDVTNVASVAADVSAFGAGTVAMNNTAGDVYNATVTVDGTNATDGIHDVAITATDSQGKSITNATNNLTLDTAPPLVESATLHDDGDGNVTDGDAVTVRVDANATGSDVGSVTANLSAFGAGSAVDLGFNATSGVYEGTAAVNASDAAADGERDVAVTVTDAAQNDAKGTTNNLTLDVTPPTVSGNVIDAHDGDGVVGDGDAIDVTADVTEATTNVTAVVANVSAFGVGNVTLEDTNDDGVYNATVDVDASNAADGTHAVTITATDGAGNDGVNTTQALALDTTAPTVLNRSVSDATDGNETVGDGHRVTVRANVTDATAVASVTADLSAFGNGSSVALSHDGGTAYQTTVSVNATSAAPDGDHAVTVTVADNQSHSGNVTTGNLTLDTTAPDVDSVSLTDDGDGVVNDGDDVTVTAEISDATSGVASVTANLSQFGAGESVTLGHAGGTTYEATVQVTDGSAGVDGDHVANVTVTDDAGNVADNDTGALTLDTTAPSLSNLSVTDDADGNGVVDDGHVVAVTANLSDANDGNATVAADLSAFGAGTVALTDGDDDGVYQGSGTVDTADANADGNYTVTVTGTDDTGNQHSSDAGNLTLDTTAPTLSGVSLAEVNGDGNVTDGDAIRVTATVADATNVSTVTADATAFGAGTVTLTDGDGDGEYQGNATVGSGAAADGNHAVTVNSTDAQGNARTNATGTLTLDTTRPTASSPTVVDTTDGDGTVTGGDFVTVSVDPGDATTGVASVTANVSAFGAGTVALADGDGDGIYDAKVAVDGLNTSADGNHTVNVTVADAAGNERNDTTGELTVDTTGPSLSALDLVDATDSNGEVAVNDSVTVRAHATDTTSDVESVTGFVFDFGVQSSVTLTDGDGDGTYDTTITVRSGASGGTQSATVSAEDAVGNSESATTPSVTVVASGPSVSNATLTELNSSDGVVADGDRVRVTATATDGDGVTQVTADASAFGAGTDVVLNDTDGDDVYNATVAVDETDAAPDGGHSVTVTARDTDGNEQDDATGSLTLNTPPEVSNFALSNPSGQTVEVRFDASEPLADVSIDLDGPATTTLTESDLTTTDVASPYTYTATWDAGADGTVTATLDTAADASGKQWPGGNLSATVTVDSSSGGGGSPGSGSPGGGGDGDDSPKTSVELPDVDVYDRGTPAATVTVENVKPSTPVSMPVNVSVANETVRVKQLEMAVWQYDYELSTRSVDGRRGEAPLGTTSFGYVEVNGSMPEEDVDYATVTFGVEAEELERRNVEPSSVALYRLQNGTWTELDPIHLGWQGDYHVFRAESSGLATFAVAGQRADRLDVVGATVNRTSVAAGNAVEVTATLENADETATTRTVRFQVDGETVATRSVRVAAGETRAVSVTRRFRTTGTHEVAVNGTRAGTVSVRRAETSTTTTQTSSTTTTATPTSSVASTSSTSTGSSTPGFTLVTALVALLVAAMLGRRR